MRNFTFLLVFILSNVVAAQTFEVQSIYNSGPDANRINLVILSDGYQASELGTFIIDANNFTNALFAESPYLEYKNYFNVYAIKVPSSQSGASHPGTATDVTEPQIPVAVVDNYFGSTFDYGSIHRLLVPIKFSAINAVLANNFPAYDQIIVLVNSQEYGGSGGNNIATSSMHPAANQIAIHELGHSFGNLRDEYWAGNQYATESGVNMTQQTNPALVKWANWMGDNGIGIYQHCCGGNSSSWYRPHQNCKMRALGDDFCSVCKEGTIEKIHALVSPIDSFSPVETSIAVGPGGNLNFSLDLVQTLPNSTLSTNWTLNGVMYNTNATSVPLTASNLVDGNNSLLVVVQDNTPMLRVNNHAAIHIYTVQWTINYDATMGVIDAQGENVNSTITAFPNPVDNFVNISFSNFRAGDFSAALYSIDGKLIKTQNSNNSDSIKLDMEGLNTGIYIVKYYLDNVYLSSQQIIKN